MDRFVRLLAPRSSLDFLWKCAILVAFGNVVAMSVVYAVHGYLPSGLRGQLTETTIIGAFFIAGFLKVVAHQFQLQQQLAQLALTDMLTGLANRRAFIKALEDARERGESGHLFLADADHFKQINDTYGHDGGDRCLIAIGLHLRAVARVQDTVARIGGEEFALYCPDAPPASPTQTGQALCRPIRFAPREAAADANLSTVTLSAGHAWVGRDDTVSSLMGLADHRLYLAKAAGRGRCHLADQSGSLARADLSSPVA